MRTAREEAHALAGCEDDYTYAAEFVPRRHRSICDRLTAAIEARDAEHLADADVRATAVTNERNAYSDIAHDRTRERDAALAALKVAREALVVINEMHDEQEWKNAGCPYAWPPTIAAGALTRISALVPS